MEDKKTIDKWMAMIIISAIIAGSYLYVEVSKLNYQKSKEEQKEEKAQENEAVRDDCFSVADSDYFSSWEGECRRLYHKKSCALPIYLSDRIEKAKNQARSECIKMYPVD